MSLIALAKNVKVIDQVSCRSSEMVIAELARLSPAIAELFLNIPKTTNPPALAGGFVFTRPISQVPVKLDH